MLFSHDVLFLHVPKTGGMSITTYLVNNLRGSICISMPRPAFEHARRLMMFDDIHDRTTLIEGFRHEDLLRAKRMLQNRDRQLSDFKLILAVVRNPYELEISHFGQWRKLARREGTARLPARLALSGDFDAFAERAHYYGHRPSRIERFYELNGAVPKNMRIVRLEQIGEIRELLKPFSFDRHPLPHENKTALRSPWESCASPRAELAIYTKYKYLFSHYERDDRFCGNLIDEVR